MKFKISVQVTTKLYLNYNAHNKFSMASKPKPKPKPAQKPETATEDVDVDENPVTDGAETDQDGIYSTNYASEEMRNFDRQHGDNESSD